MFDEREVAALPGERILTADQAARILRVSRKTLYKLAASGQLGGRKVGRAWRFLERDLVKYLGGQPDQAHQRDPGAA